MTSLANGGAETGFQDVKGQLRATNLGLEARNGVDITILLTFARASTGNDLVRSLQVLPCLDHLFCCQTPFPTPRPFPSFVMSSFLGTRLPPANIPSLPEDPWLLPRREAMWVSAPPHPLMWYVTSSIRTSSSRLLPWWAPCGRQRLVLHRSVFTSSIQTSSFVPCGNIWYLVPHPSTLPSTVLYHPPDVWKGTVGILSSHTSHHLRGRGVSCASSIKQVSVKM